MFEAKLECPRCGKILTVPQGMTDAECDCHTYCPRGTKPADCNMTYIDSQTINWGYPTNMDVNSANEGEDIVHRKAYCSVHQIYSYKEPIVLEVDWTKWRSQKKLSSSLKEIQNRL